MICGWPPGIHSTELFPSQSRYFTQLLFSLSVVSVSYWLVQVLCILWPILYRECCRYSLRLYKKKAGYCIKCLSQMIFGSNVCLGYLSNGKLLLSLSFQRCIEKLLLSEVKCWLCVGYNLLFLAGRAFFLFSVFWQIIGLWGNSVQGFFRNCAILSTGEAIGFGTGGELAVHLKMPNRAWLTSLLSHFVCVCETFFRMLAFTFSTTCCAPSLWEITTRSFSPALHPQHTQSKHPNHSTRCSSHFED